jgi:hypothetical protein
MGVSQFAHARSRDVTSGIAAESFGPFRPSFMAWRLVLLAAALYVSFLTYLTFGLDFSLFRSDVAKYWSESLHIDTPYSQWWVPGYPMLIAAVRTATIGALSPTAVMGLISGTSYVVGVLLAFAVARQLQLKHPARVALVFAVYPFVGLTYTVWPIADSLATTLLLGCYLAFEQRRWALFTVCAAAALMVHKAMWFFVPPLMGVAFLNHKESRTIVPLAFVPLVTWLLMGAIYYQDLLWFARWGMEHLVVSRSHLPVLDGLISPFLDGSATKVAKGIVLLAIVSTAVVAASLSLRMRFWGGLALTLPILVLALAMNQYEIWAVVRFSRVLVIPAAYVAATIPSLNFIFSDSRVFGVILAGSAITNVAYALYMSQVFFA